MLKRDAIKPRDDALKQKISDLWNRSTLSVIRPRNRASTMNHASGLYEMQIHGSHGRISRCSPDFPNNSVRSAYDAIAAGDNVTLTNLAYVIYSHESKGY